MPRLMSFTKTWPQFKDGSKTVTRRSRRTNDLIRKGLMHHDGSKWAPGWPVLNVGDVIEGIEWLPRWTPHGARWVCDRCGWLGHTDPSDTQILWLEQEHYIAAAGSCRPSFVWRAPERLPGTRGLRRIVSVRDEMLYEITDEDVAAEGFPGRRSKWFHKMYCGTAGVTNRPVNRIEFEEV